MKRAAVIFSSLIMLICLCGCNVLGFLGGDTLSKTAKDFSPQEGFDTCYFSLAEKQKAIYSVLYSCAIEMPDGFINICDLYDGVEADLNIAYTAMLYDNPEFFWMPATYIIGNSSGVFHDKVSVAFKYSDKEYNSDYLVSKEVKEIMQDTLNKKVEEILGSVPHGDEFDIQTYLDEYLCQNIEYAEDADFANTVYGALVRGKALCEGYAKSYKLLCNELGIKCDLTVGIGENEPHMWNTVFTDGEYAYTDVTWNDLGTGSSRMYFNINEKTLLKNHKIDSLFYEMTLNEISDGNLFNFVKRNCESNENSHFVKNGLVLESDYAQKAAEIVTKNLQSGKTQESFWLVNDADRVFKTNRQQFVFNIQEELTNVKIQEFLYDNQVLVLFYSENPAIEEEEK